MLWCTCHMLQPGRCHDECHLPDPASVSAQHTVQKCSIILTSLPLSFYFILCRESKIRPCEAVCLVSVQVEHLPHCTLDLELETKVYTKVCTQGKGP